MAESSDLLEQQKKTAAFLTRPRLRFETKSAEQLAVETEEKARLEVEQYANVQSGDKMPDGSVFAGISPETGKPMFTMPADADVTMIFNDAAKYVKKLNSEHTLGHDDWRVPTKDELNVLFQNKDQGALKGTFNVTGSFLPHGWYCSSPHNFNGIDYAQGQRFSDGNQTIVDRSYRLSVRPVRS